MTGHDRFLELAASAIDFELTNDESIALQRHLSSCETCRWRTAQIRGDASAIAALPLLRAGWSVPALALERGLRGATSSSLRLIAVVALTLAIVAGAAVVGAEITRRQELVVPTVTTGPTPTSRALTTPAPSPGPVAGKWRVESLDVGQLPFGLTAVAGSGSRLVAIGWRTCKPEPEQDACWASVFTSDDGGRAWVAAPHSDTLAVSFGAIDSGPQPGMLDIAAGHGAFVAIGYDGQYRATAWKSVDGRTWTLSPSNAIGDQARVRAVTATATGWVIGGEVFLDAGPRAAIWASPDGVTWTRAPDGPAFDVGGYLDTGEEPGSGGIADVAASGSTTIAVGSSCDQKGANCVPAAWISSGGPWSRSARTGAFTGKLRAVASFGNDFLAAGWGCASEPCTQGERAAAVGLRSGDGAEWAEHKISGTTGSVGVRALGATAGYLVGVVEGVEGVDGVDAHQTGELILVGSVDGDNWEVLGDVPPLGLSDIRGVGLTATADGSILVVGWGEAPTLSDGFKSFMVLVTRTPS